MRNLNIKNINEEVIEKIDIIAKKKKVSRNFLIKENLERMTEEEIFFDVIEEQNKLIKQFINIMKAQSEEINEIRKMIEELS